VHTGVGRVKEKVILENIYKNVLDVERTWLEPNIRKIIGFKAKNNTGDYLLNM